MYEYNVDIFMGAFLATYLFVFLGLLLVGYVIQGITLMNVAKVKGLKAWKAWVPFANMDLSCEAGNGKKKILWGALGSGFACCVIAGIFTALVPALGMLLIIVAYGLIAWGCIYEYIMIYRICKDFNVSVVLFWVGIFFSVVIYVMYIMIAINANKVLKARASQE